MPSILLVWYNHFCLHCGNIFLTRSTLISKISSLLSSFLIFICFDVQISQPYKSDGIVEILYTFSCYCLWTKFGFKTFFRILRICKNLFKDMSFSSLYETLHPKYVNILACSNIALCIAILLVVGTCCSVLGYEIFKIYGLWFSFHHADHSTNQ